MKDVQRSGFLVIRILVLIAFLLLATGIKPIPVVAQEVQSPEAQDQPADLGEIARQLGVLKHEGVSALDFSLETAGWVAKDASQLGPSGPDANIPLILDGDAAFSAALMVGVGGPLGDFAEVDFLADIDGREDYVADHGAKVDDLTPRMPFTTTMQITRVAASAHTIANGFTENVFYYGDSVGNVYVATGTKLGSPFVDPSTAGSDVLKLNLPTALNAFGSLTSDDQIVITGIAVNPVSDLSAFANFNGSFSPFAGLTGEIVYVSYWDPGGLRLSSNNVIVHSGVLAFPVADIPSLAAAPPGVVSNTGFDVMVGGMFGVVFSVFSNLAGVAVDQDGSIYFQNVDLATFTGANIIKITDIGSDQDRSAAVGQIMTITTLNPVNGVYGTTSGPSSQVNRVTNYSGTSPTFGNVTALAGGPHNTLYAALARSHNPADDLATQNSSGLFENPGALGPTPSMILSFADVTGAFDPCSSYPYTFTAEISPGVTQTLPYPGVLPIGDDFADIAQPGGVLTPGVNNFRLFALGTGPDIRSDFSPIGATITNTQKMDFQVDYSIYSGLAVDEVNSVYLISGGTPAGVGRNPSPDLGEILVFPDRARFDRRADFIDLRADVTPVPPLSANVGNGVSNRYDHIFYTAPIDSISVAPAGLSGLNRGHLLYLNRTRNDGARFTYLPNGSTQGDDATSGPIPFMDFDGIFEQVAGGDDFQTPFKGDNLSSGFELRGSTTYTETYLNSNGNLTFGSGDIDNTPTETELFSGPTRIAAAWTDLNPPARSVSTRNFPVQALGFAGSNSFVVRWINVPTYGQELCASRNSLAVTLYDDGVGEDESAIGQVEGPTDNQFDPALSPMRWRGDGSQWFYLDYGRVDLIGDPAMPVLAGFSIGGNMDEPPEDNLGNLARDIFAVGGYYPAIPSAPNLTKFEFFDDGTVASLVNPGPAQVFTPADPDYDLRFTGNDPAAATPAGQPDPNWDVLAFLEGFATFFPITIK